MAEYIEKLHCRKDGNTEEIAIYSTLEEVQGQGITVSIGDMIGYVKYGAIDDTQASQLNCKIPNDENGYKVHLSAKPKDYTITMTARRNNEEKMQDLPTMTVPAGEKFYLNNANAPTIDGYDFVMAIPNNFTPENDSTVNVYYIPNTVPDNKATEFLYNEEAGDLILTDAVNTYSAVSVAQMFSGHPYLITAPKINTSNVTHFENMFSKCEVLQTIPPIDTSKGEDMSYMFSNCRELKTIPQIDTSSVTRMRNMFASCTQLEEIPKMNTSRVENMAEMFSLCKALKEIPWEIDMASCTWCKSMFSGCPAEGIRLKNVPSTLDLSTIGTENYTVVNYI